MICLLKTYYKIINRKQHPEHLQEEPLGCLILEGLNDLLKTDYLPHDGRDSRLGFPGTEDFPEGFVGQNLHGFGKGEIIDFFIPELSKVPE